jgi:hypothetical protein
MRTVREFGSYAREGFRYPRNVSVLEMVVHAIKAVIMCAAVVGGVVVIIV